MLNEFNIETLQQTFPYLNWLDYINWNLNNNVTLDKNDPIIIADKNYVYQLGTVLQKTASRTIANYFAWNAIKSSSRFLNDVLHKRGEQYLAEITGIQKSKSRLIDCVERTQISYANFLSIHKSIEMNYKRIGLFFYFSAYQLQLQPHTFESISMTN